MKSKKKSFLTVIGLLVGTSLVFVGLLTLSNFIPRENLYPQIQASAAQVAEYRTADEATPQMYSQYKMDYYTDSVMLNVAYFTDTAHPLEAVVAGWMYGGGVEQLAKVASHPHISPNYAYSRYWHGYLIVLRPLLLFFDYIQIGVFNTYLLFFLLFFNLILVYKKIGGWFAAVFLFTVISLNIIVLPLNMQLFTVFALTFIALPVVIWLFEKRRTWLKYGFMLIGMCTMYFDFYTYPVMTFGFPMIVLLMTQEQKNDPDKKPIRQVLTLFAFWALGYAAAWLIKIGLVYMVLGGDEVQTAGDSFAARISRSIPASTYEKLSGGLSGLAPGLSLDSVPLWCISLGLVAMPLMQPVFLVGLAALVLAALAFRIFGRHTKRDVRTVWAVLLVSALPILWYVIAVNPTIIHFYFQYRGIGVTLLGVISVLMVPPVFGCREQEHKRIES